MGYRIVGDGPYYAADLATNGRTKSRFHTHAEAQAWIDGRTASTLLARGSGDPRPLNSDYSGELERYLARKEGRYLD